MMKARPVKLLLDPKFLQHLKELEVNALKASGDTKVAHKLSAVGHHDVDSTHDDGLSSNQARNSIDSYFKNIEAHRGTVAQPKTHQHNLASLSVSSPKAHVSGLKAKSIRRHQRLAGEPGEEAEAG
eukprot:CAMPEP_0113694948 /NCGR_PEP_ID=MMETSP0038_2-20120614/20601_1 /TAXON_ID=2898 /ORGANISM="Cryptomonas paramecium" /LENGTH=125 /DNA_ID=CAMNT_0000617383 /DNA_START=87 /DNA_END=460 /DNA_ORIENTATION=+ /assembly_acc=CAM_ASM_000170